MATYIIEPVETRPFKLFFEDEARFGKINIVSRSLSTQSNKGNCIPTIGFYAYTTVYPETGDNYSIISPANNIEVM